MYTQADRERIRAEIVEAARGDTRISGGAITGSAAAGREDAWSDIDLAFGLRDGSTLPSVLEDFSARMRDRYGALDTVDVPAGPWLYRVFLLPSTLQVDLAFVPEEHFGARAPTFRLVFGKAADTLQVQPPTAQSLIGYAWLYALHVRSCLARGKAWQAEYMLHNMRDRVLALACLRLGVPTSEGRGFDQLPREAVAPLEAGYAARPESSEIARAFGVVSEALLAEIRHVDPSLEHRLAPALTELAGARG